MYNEKKHDMFSRVKKCPEVNGGIFENVLINDSWKFPIKVDLYLK